MHEEEPHSSQSGKLKRYQNKLKKISWKAWLAIVAVIALLAAVAWFAYDYKQTKDEVKAAQAEANKFKDPQEAARAATAKLIEEVGKLTDLPQGETPTVATVSDVTKLKNQAFFAKAQNGDKVLIYTQAKRAILYRPSTNKVIEIAPVNLGSSNSNGSNSSDANQ